jgi:hypothetical protein
MKAKASFVLALVTLLFMGWSGLLPAWGESPGSTSEGFTIIGADGANYFPTAGSSELEGLISQVPPRFILQFAEGLKYHTVEPAPEALVTLISQIGHRYVLQHAGGNRFYATAYPVVLIGDTVPPQISGVAVASAGAKSASVTWQTNELATSTLRYGTQPGNYPHTITNSLYRMQHTITLSGLVVGGKYYYRVSSTDRSGNTSQSQEYQFTVPLRVYLPFVRR